MVECVSWTFLKALGLLPVLCIGGFIGVVGYRRILLRCPTALEALRHKAKVKAIERLARDLRDR